MIESKDFLAGKRFKIVGVYGIKIHQDELLRDEKEFTVYLNLEYGVLDFVEEQSPYVSIKVIDLLSREDVTKEYVGNNVEFVKSKFNQPLQGGTLKQVYK